MNESSMSPRGSAEDLTVCMPTWRRFYPAAFLSGGYEAQDVLADVCALDLVPLRPSWGFRTREHWLRRMTWKDPSGLLAHFNPGLRPVTLAKHYDLFVVYCQTLKELMFVNALQGWQDHARKTVCIVAELYAGDIEASRNFLNLLQKFDYVFTELCESVPAITRAIERPCHCLPAAVDAIRFTPFRNNARKVVDVYSIGRRRPEIHGSLMQLSSRNEIFYIYDTFAGGAEASITDYVAHRELVAGIAKRSLSFMVAPAKWDVPEETRGQVAIASRYFEGAAAGAVMVGQPSDTDEFRELFDWPDVVIPAAEDGSDIGSVVRMLKSEPEFADAVGRRNAVHALLRHDWAYRWRQLFEMIGERPGPSLTDRETRLRELALTGAGPGAR